MCIYIIYVYITYKILCTIKFKVKNFFFFRFKSGRYLNVFSALNSVKLI